MEISKNTYTWQLVNSEWSGSVGCSDMRQMAKSSRWTSKRYCLIVADYSPWIGAEISLLCSECEEHSKVIHQDWIKVTVRATDCRPVPLHRHEERFAILIMEDQDSPTNTRYCKQRSKRPLRSCMAEVKRKVTQFLDQYIEEQKSFRP